MTFVMERVENIVGKGENAGYQHFLLFPQFFQKASLSECKKSGLCSKELKGWKSLRKTDKMLVTRLFSYSQNGFHGRPLKLENVWLKHYTNHMTFHTRSWVTLSLHETIISDYYHSINPLWNKIFFRLIQIESICQLQNKFD